jgi:dienelactone hydrolase
MSDMDARKRLAADVQAWMIEAMRRDREAWEQVETCEDWERFRDERLDALRRSLGMPGERPGALDVHVTGELPGDGYRIRKLVFETQPGVLVTALLYLPDPLPASMPGIQIVHAHHRPKHQAELQDMGVNWARTGSAVLVPDLVGHGERGDDPFGERQGYYARYYEAMQLGLVGESLAGWMVWDLICGTSVLLDLPGIDPERIILIGSVAGGGDLAGMAAALDRRVTCLIPFNYGQGSKWRTDLGETPDGQNLAGWSYWETTRNLRRCAADGFLPYVIVAATAPRYLIYAHEFAWDAEADEAWRRILRVYELYGAIDRAGSMKGAGRCAPGAGNTHCTNVGPLHRSKLYPYLEQWFGMPTPDEIEDRRGVDELACMTPELAGRRRALREIAAEKATGHLAGLRGQRQDADGGPVKGGGIEGVPRCLTTAGQAVPPSPADAGVRIDVVRPPGVDRPPVVVAVAHEGAAGFKSTRAKEIQRLLERGIAVASVDVRGTGASSLDDSHGLNSAYINVSEDLRMLGLELLGLQLHDLRRCIGVLRESDEVDGDRIALWGDSFAPVNPRDYEVGEHDGKLVDHHNWPNPPYGGAWVEPAGALLALLAGGREPSVRAVLARRGLASFQTLFDHWALRVPSDATLPGLPEGDVAELAAAIRPRPVRIEGCVDALNRELGGEEPEVALGRGPKGRAVCEGIEISAARCDAAEWFARVLEA